MRHAPVVALTLTLALLLPACGDTAPTDARAPAWSDLRPTDAELRVDIREAVDAAVRLEMHEYRMRHGRIPSVEEVSEMILRHHAEMVALADGR